MVGKGQNRKHPVSNMGYRLAPITVIPAASPESANLVHAAIEKMRCAQVDSARCSDGSCRR
jgi:hypothetical protein